MVVVRRQPRKDASDEDDRAEGLGDERSQHDQNDKRDTAAERHREQQLVTTVDERPLFRDGETEICDYGAEQEDRQHQDVLERIDREDGNDDGPPGPVAEQLRDQRHAEHPQSSHGYGDNH